MANAVQFQVASAGTRRVVEARPAGRPALRAPQARPARTVAPGRLGSATSCAAVTSPVKPSPWLTLKLAAVGLIAAVGVGVSAVQFVEMSEPNPAYEYVAGDPAWSHVNP